MTFEFNNFCIFHNSSKYQQEMYQEDTQQIQISQYYNKFNIRQRKYEITLPTQQMSSIDYLFMVYNQSYVLGWSKKLLHISNKGQILNQIFFLQELVVEAFAISPRVILILTNQKQKYRIVQWNLSTNGTISVDFYRQQIKSLSKMDMLIFCQSKLVCVVERFEDQKKKKQFFWLNYFRYPLKSQKDKPIHSCTFQLQEKNLTKVNNKCMLGWLPKNVQYSKFTEVFIYSPDNLIREGGKPSEKIYIFDNSFNRYPNITSLRPIDLWEVKQKVFYIKFESQFKGSNGISNFFNERNKVQFQTTKQERQLEKQQFSQSAIIERHDSIQQQYSFIWHYKTGQIRPTTFKIGRPHITQFVGQFRNINRRTYPQKSLRQRMQIKDKDLNKYEFREENYFLPIAFVDVRQESQKLICVQKQTTLKISFYHRYDLYPKYQNFSMFNSQNYYYLFLIKKRFQNAVSKKIISDFIFDPWSSSEEETQYEETFERQKKLKLKETKNEKGNKSKNIYDYDLILTTYKRKLKYFQYSLSQVAVWALLGIMQNWDEDLMYYVCNILSP